jgi:chemotaxis protein histidine kinase CheA
MRDVINGPPMGANLPEGDGLDELRAELDATFLEELAERLPQMDAAATRLEGTDGADRQGALQQLARQAHSLKGGAQIVGRTEIARLAEALENCLDAGHTRAGNVPAPEVDAAIAAIAGLAMNEGPSAAEVERLVAALAPDGPY